MDETTNETAYRDMRRVIIKRLFEDLPRAYRQAKQDFRRFAELEFSAPEDSYSVPFAIEVLGANIAGLASHVEVGRVLDNAQMDLLRASDLFAERGFAEWWQSSHDDFPLLAAYVLQVDYLRLLLMDYCRRDCGEE